MSLRLIVTDREIEITAWSAANAVDLPQTTDFMDSLSITRTIQTMEHAFGPPTERITMTTKTSNSSETEDIDQFVVWWESFVKSIATDYQHYHDYLNDMDCRRKFEGRLAEIDNKQLKAKLIHRIKVADEEFIKLTDLCPEGIHDNPEVQYLPDSEWFYFRRPRVVGKDFPKLK